MSSDAMNNQWPIKQAPLSKDELAKKEACILHGLSKIMKVNRYYALFTRFFCLILLLGVVIANSTIFHFDWWMIVSFMLALWVAYEVGEGFVIAVNLIFLIVFVPINADIDIMIAISCLVTVLGILGALRLNQHNKISSLNKQLRQLKAVKKHSLLYADDLHDELCRIYIEAVRRQPRDLVAFEIDALKKRLRTIPSLQLEESNAMQSY